MKSVSGNTCSVASADELVEAVLARYSKAGSYKDSGKTSGPWQISFSTYFERPDFFRFEWVDARGQGDKLLLVKDGRDVRAYFDRTWTKYRSLEFMLKIAGGATMGTTTFIGQLLFPELSFPSPLQELKPFNLIDECQPSEKVVESNYENEKVIERLTIDIDELEICHRELTLKQTGATDPAMISYLRESRPGLADMVINKSLGEKDRKPITSKIAFETRSFDFR